MKIMVIGSEGSMGQRYRAILRYLGHSFVGVDVQHDEETVLDLASRVDGVIIATPTPTHSYFIHLLSPTIKVPILCEKPICKHPDELKDILTLCEINKTNLTVMMQYKMLLDPARKGFSHYDYFRTGNDGLTWDCFQIIALSNGPVRVANTAPVWDCMINGQKLFLSDMDRAYVDFVQKWIEEPGDDLKEIEAFHQKVVKYERDHGAN